MDDNRGATSVPQDGYTQGAPRGTSDSTGVSRTVLFVVVLVHVIRLTQYLQVRQLMGPTLYTPPLVAFVLLLQLSLAYAFRHTYPLSPLFLVTAYVIGGTANQNIFLAIHEITHNLAFKGMKANKLLAITANLSIGVPYAMAFKGYHIEHHRFLGEDGIDTDLPTRLEAVLLNNVAGKTFFASVMISSFV